MKDMDYERVTMFVRTFRSLHPRLVRFWARACLGGLALACSGVAWPQAGGPAALRTTPASPAPLASACPPILQHRFTRLQDEKPQDLCQYAGRVVLVVNTASYCGFTGQYGPLEALYARYQSQGLVVLGFPSNDFGRQEPGSNQAIADFCENTYGVRFPMLSKTVVVGAAANPLYRQLTARTGEAPAWNFHKYLISRDGRQIQSFPSAMAPDNPAILMAIEKYISTKK